MAGGKNELPKSEAANLKGQTFSAEKDAELSEKDLDEVSGGLKKLPGKRTPPTITLKRGKNQSTDL